MFIKILNLLLRALQLYFLMHHNCARFYGTRLSFEILATEHCSQVYREHQLIAALDSKQWQELYIEQSKLYLKIFFYLWNLCKIQHFVYFDVSKNYKTKI